MPMWLEAEKYQKYSIPEQDGRLKVVLASSLPAFEIFFIFRGDTSSSLLTVYYGSERIYVGVYYESLGNHMERGRMGCSCSFGASLQACSGSGLDEAVDGKD